jgi:quinol monooxygenase YgiN
MTRFALLVTVRVHAESVDEFRTGIRAAAAEAVRAEPDCLRFEVAQDEEDPTTFVLFEVYTDAAALEHHHTTPHFLGFVQTSGHMIAEKSRRRLVLHGP